MSRRLYALILLTLVAQLSLPTQSQTWISGVTVNTTSTTAALSWNTAVPAFTMARYGLNTNYGMHTNFESVAARTHLTNLVRLTPGTVYHFRLVAKDAGDVVVNAFDATFTTQASAVSISVTPTGGTLASGASVQCVARVTNATNKGATWTATAGSVTAAGLFTAPAVSATQNVTVTATSVADPTKSASAVFVVTPPVQHSVVLNWNASSSSNIVAYSAYRSTISGGPYGLMASALTGLFYTDASVQAGTTYYYVVTATNDQGEESVDSNQVSAVIPSP